MPTKMTDPEEPDTLARRAGLDIYGSRVGALRRVELWRLGNLWGLNFPVGASKDFMIPFFQRLEAEGKNPMMPPGKPISHIGELRSRDVKYSDESHVEEIKVDPNEFKTKLEAVHHGKLKKICKMRGIPQLQTDKKADLVARILAACEGNILEQNIAKWSE